jgi:predicted kinase
MPTMTQPENGPGQLQRGTSALVIARNIRNAIEAGKLPHGQQLPSTRALADEWGTSVATITRAMAILADEGIVQNRARSSRIVNFPPRPANPYSERRPQIFLVGGYAGSGKTELGHVMSRETGWTMLDKDTTTRPVVETALVSLGQSRDDRESETYLSVVRPSGYEALLAGMIENVECGNSTIVTAPFIREFSDAAWCKRMAATAESLHADLHLIWVRCDDESMRMYIQRRGAARDAAKLSDWTTYLGSINVDFKPAAPHHIIDNSVGAAPLQEQARALLAEVCPAERRR